MDVDVVIGESLPDVSQETTALPHDVVHLILSDWDLPKSDIARAARVCKAWHETAIPLLYGSLDIAVPDTALAPLLWGAPHLRKMIQKLTIRIFRDNQASEVLSALGWLAWIKPGNVANLTLARSG
ncbi:hypothetical protein AURDEDRAFT_123628 [Auricularia subglabra TFB-10046 SS5]|nr:hypothetical protein AURDEDRAFT_123628 [Auricularia subglabra TFB-10046 SS5]